MPSSIANSPCCKFSSAGIGAPVSLEFLGARTSNGQQQLGEAVLDTRVFQNSWSLTFLGRALLQSLAGWGMATAEGVIRRCRLWRARTWGVAVRATLGHV